MRVEWVQEPSRPVTTGTVEQDVRAIIEQVRTGGDAAVRELGYYTGTIFEVYDPAVAFALGGGRYDDLLGRFGRERPACGAGLDVTRVHVAQLEEERG